MFKNVYNKALYSQNDKGIATVVRLQYKPLTGYKGITTGFYAHECNRKKNLKSLTYLGVTIAEKVLSKIFKNVKLMPYGNPGYDFKCGKGFLVDVKSGCIRKNYIAWTFHINKNIIADYFLCLAFDNRDNLNPLHVWLIPNKRVSHLGALTISLSKLDKWSQYELNKLDNVKACCATLRNIDTIK